MGRGKNGITKVYKKTFLGDGYAYYLDCDSDFTGIYICQNVSNCILQIHAVYYMSVTHTEREKECVCVCVRERDRATEREEEEKKEKQEEKEKGKRMRREVK